MAQAAAATRVAADEQQFSLLRRALV